MDNELIIMVGLPGSGKTTLAKKLIREGIDEYFSSDSLRMELLGNKEYSPSDNHIIFEELHKRIKESLITKDSFFTKRTIYDATNINAKRRKTFLSQFSKFYDKAIIVFVDADVETCIKNDLSRIGNGYVGKDVIERMARNLDEPTRSEECKENTLLILSEEECCKRYLKEENLC